MSENNKYIQLEQRTFKLQSGLNINTFVASDHGSIDIHSCKCIYLSSFTSHEFAHLVYFVIRDNLQITNCNT